MSNSDAPVWSSLNDMQMEGIIKEIAQASTGDSALYPVIVSIGLALRMLIWWRCCDD